MNDPSDGAVRARQIEDQAAEWMVLHDRGFTPAQQDAFLQWLAADAAHREALRRYQALWTEFDLLAQWRPEHSAQPNPDLLARTPRRGMRHGHWGALSLVAAGVALLVAWFPQSRFTADSPTSMEASAYRQQVLPDGSTVDFNAGAHVVVQFSPNERRVVLVQGEAQFSVAKHPTRPFVVRAGGMDVRAVGTAFNVKLAGGQVEVLVTEGTVQVAAQMPPSDPGRAANRLGTGLVLAELTAGHRTIIPFARPATPPEVVAVPPAEIEQLLDWKPRLFDFDATPLSEVVAAFNQRNTVQLRLADPALQALPVVASIRSDNLDGFVRLLEATMSVRAEQRGANEIVLRRAP